MSTSISNLSYIYDAPGRLVAIATTDGQTHRYTYQPGTRQLATRTSGNVTTSYAYDTGRGMLTSIENKNGDELRLNLRRYSNALIDAEMKLSNLRREFNEDKC
jgi:hypothetical protein